MIYDQWGPCQPDPEDEMINRRSALGLGPAAGAALYASRKSEWYLSYAGPGCWFSGYDFRVCGPSRWSSTIGLFSQKKREGADVVTFYAYNGNHAVDQAYEWLPTPAGQAWLAKNGYDPELET